MNSLTACTGHAIQRGSERRMIAIISPSAAAITNPSTVASRVILNPSHSTGSASAARSQLQSTVIAPPSRRIHIVRGGRSAGGGSASRRHLLPCRRGAGDRLQRRVGGKAQYVTQG